MESLNVIFKQLFKKGSFYIFRKTISNKLIPEKIYVLLFNYYLKLNKIKSKVFLNKNKTPKFFIEENHLKKYFHFRERGIIFFKKGVQKRGEKLGNEYLLNLINFKNDDIIIDIGANTGDLHIYLSSINQNLNYFGFEPAKIEFICLNSNINDKGESINFAAGNRNEEILFYYKPETGDSSIVKMNNYQESYLIKTVRLDDWILEKKFRGIKLLKLEAEGFEPEIIQGLVNSLKIIEYISADLGPERGENYENTVPDVINELFKNNFVIVSFNDERNIFLMKNKNFESST